MSSGIPSSIKSAPLLKQWVRLLDDGSFQIYSGKVELGQGISTALVKVACEELGIHPDMVDLDRKSTRLNSSHVSESRMPSSA